MKELMYLLRAMQLYAHSCHHLVKGNSFHADHAFFKAVYEEVEGNFDDVSERIIGLYTDEPLNLQSLISGVSAKLMDAPSTGVADNKVFYDHLMKMELSLQELCKQIVQVASPGTEQLVGDIANFSEARCYKIKQRLK